MIGIAISIGLGELVGELSDTMVRSGALPSGNKNDSLFYGDEYEIEVTFEGSAGGSYSIAPSGLFTLWPTFSFTANLLDQNYDPTATFYPVSTSGAPVSGMFEPLGDDERVVLRADATINGYAGVETVGIGYTITRSATGAFTTAISSIYQDLD